MANTPKTNNRMPAARFLKVWKSNRTDGGPLRLAAGDNLLTRSTHALAIRRADTGSPHYPWEVAYEPARSCRLCSGTIPPPPSRLRPPAAYARAAAGIGSCRITPSSGSQGSSQAARSIARAVSA